MTNEITHCGHERPPTELELQINPTLYNMMAEERNKMTDATDDGSTEFEQAVQQDRPAGNEEELYHVRPEYDQKYEILPLVGGTLANLVNRFNIRDSYRITNRRIVIEHDGGLFGTDSTKEYPLRSIADIESYSTFSQRRHECGTVTFSEHDGEASEVTMEWIPDHEEIADTLRRLATEEQARHRNPTGSTDRTGW